MHHSNEEEEYSTESTFTHLSKKERKRLLSVSEFDLKDHDINHPDLLTITKLSAYICDCPRASATLQASILKLKSSLNFDVTNENEYRRSNLQIENSNSPNTGCKNSKVPFPHHKVIENTSTSLVTLDSFDHIDLKNLKEFCDNYETFEKELI
jgi:hypothetical protein